MASCFVCRRRLFAQVLSDDFPKAESHVVGEIPVGVGKLYNSVPVQYKNTACSADVNPSTGTEFSNYEPLAGYLTRVKKRAYFVLVNYCGKTEKRGRHVSKDTTISFRVSKDLSTSLAKVAREEKRSVSSLIETVLTGYLRERKALQGAEVERRHYPRKALLIPAVVNQEEQGQMAVGAIADISLSGVGIDIARDEKYQIPVGPEGVRFELIFNLPSENRLIHMSCESKRVVETNDGTRVGASFSDADFKAYQALQTYLM